MQKRILVVCIAIVLVIVAIIGAVIFFNSHGEPEPELALVEVDNTPILQIYAAINDINPTIAELEEAAHKINPEAEISVDSYGAGYVKVSGEDDFIAFDYYDEPGIDPTTGELISDDIDGKGITPQPEVIAKHIRYSIVDGDNNYYIGYSEDSGAYHVYNMMAIFEFPTKQEAIEAFLTPVVIEQ